MKFPSGIQAFEKIRKGGCAYVDKTDLDFPNEEVSRGFLLVAARRTQGGRQLLVGDGDD